ncbi:Fe-S cluster assembly protein SufU [Spiroplasma chinense]|uniref:Fe-S cluster assembly protein SufU n=1 Tax=Spiroplasma chinense TaxID=216932 RepID=A0A5B9Y763_9MOLU|nr:iron-sulfur cluster assembly scaffold protein [Spiroplasma chinense]QEH62137.1 Fe-S cluster assembly protein SufU [Spiroplasma chinense]
MIDKQDKIQLRQIIMEHYTKPDNKGIDEGKENSFIKYQDSPTCADEINVQLILKDGQVLEANFDGLTCAISGAAIDILCDQMKDKSKQEALDILNNYHKMIIGEKYDEKMLDELIAFWEIGKQGNRINCALLGADGLRHILENEAK